MSKSLFSLGPVFWHDGVPMSTAFSSEERLEAVQNFADIRDDDVIVWGYPKSGNHFVHDIVRKLQHNGDIDFSIKDSVDAFLESAIPDAFIYNHAKKTPQSLDDISEMLSPRVIGTHMHHNVHPRLVREGKCKVLYIRRNPKDIVVSWFKMLEFGLQGSGLQMVPWADFVEAFLDGHIWFGSWFQHLKDWHDVKDKPHIMNLLYEELIKDLRGNTRKIASFIGKELSDEVIDRVAESCSFGKAKKQFPKSPFIRNGTSGSWKEHFTVAQNEAFDRRLQQDLAEVGLTLSNIFPDPSPITI